MASISQASRMVTAMLQKNMQLLERENLRDSEIVIPYLEGPPGIGKTALVQQVAKALGLRLEVVRLSEYEPSDMAGWNLPSEDHKTMHRTIPAWIPTDGVPTLIFFDEMPQGHVMLQNVAAQAMNEHRVGPHRIPDNCLIVSAGNRHSDRAGTNRMPTHLADRLTFIEVEANVDDTVMHFTKHDIDSRICAYLKFRPDQLSVFDRDAKACPSPRSWERVNTLIGTDLPNELKMLLVRGQVGEAAATDFADFLRLVTRVPDIEELIANPKDETKAPTQFEGADVGIMYAIAAALIPRLDEKNAKNIVTYIRRLPRKEIAAYVISGALRRDKARIARIDAVYDWLVDEGKKYMID